MWGRTHLQINQWGSPRAVCDESGANRRFWYCGSNLLDGFFDVSCQAVMVTAMLSFSLRRISILGKTASLLGDQKSRCMRGIVTGAKAVNTKKLPLAGVRVLDMSRVLAGVRINAGSLSASECLN